MLNMKHIALTQRIIEIKEYSEIRDTLDAQWARLFQHLNFIPVILPTFCDFDQLINNISFEGIILTGGNDLSDFSEDPLSLIRDNFEKQLLGYALSNNIPVLGVCRGAQLIASYFNGTLLPVKNHADTNHKLIVNNNSSYKDILDNIDIVNSYHNYAIKDISSDFIVSARAEDNTIEAIEHKSARVAGHMWHPERSRPFSEFEMALIKNILE